MERLQTFLRNIFVVSIIFRTFEVEKNYKLTKYMKKTIVDKIGSLFKSGQVREICRKITHGNALSDELEQEVAISLLTLTDKAVKDKNLMEGNNLIKYIGGIVRNQWCSKTSPFFRKFRADNLKTISYENER